MIICRPYRAFIINTCFTGVSLSLHPTPSYLPRYRGRTTCELSSLMGLILLKHMGTNVTNGANYFQNFRLYKRFNGGNGSQ